jgi:hypothetical protein
MWAFKLSYIDEHNSVVATGFLFQTGETLYVPVTLLSSFVQESEKRWQEGCKKKSKVINRSECLTMWEEFLYKRRKELYKSELE